MTEPESSEISDVRALLDPVAFKNQLTQAQNTIRDRLTGLFIDLDLVRENPEISEEIKSVQVPELERQVRDMKWRYDETTRRLVHLEEMQKAAVGA